MLETFILQENAADAVKIVVAETSKSFILPLELRLQTAV
jgi:hypothetical protein